MKEEVCISGDAGQGDKENIIYRDKLFNWQIISKNRNILFGISILWIILLHTTNYPVIDKWQGFREHSLLFSLYNLIDLGGAGVDIFLFLSGIGLYYSFSKCTDLKKFYVKRFKRVLIPYLIWGTGYWFIRDIIYAQNPNGFLEDLFWVTYYTDGVSTYWYISFILVMYLLFPLFYYMLESRHRNLNLVLLLALSIGLIAVMYNGNLELYLHIEKSVARIPVFILGCYWGRIVKSAKPMSEGWVIYALIIPWIGGILQYTDELGIVPWKITSRLWYGLLAIAICILFSMIFAVVRLERIRKFLNMAGTLSLELYLIHIALQRLMKLWYPDYESWSMAKNCIMYLLVVVIASFITANVYHYLSKKLTEKMKLCTTIRKRPFI